ncbi:MAG: ATP-binding protein [Acidobacteriota bacterium]
MVKPVSYRAHCQLILVVLVAGALGFGLNAFPIPVGLDLQLILGPVVPLIIALTFGPLPGMAAALLAGLETVFLWEHSLALPFLTAQAFVVGWCVRHWKWRVLYADAVFWVAGAPFLYLLHVRSGVYPDGLGLAVAFKYVVNGLLCTTLADSCLGWPAFVRWLARYGANVPENTLVARLTRLLTLVGVIPACSLAIWQAYATSTRQVNEVRAELAAHARLMATAVRLEVMDGRDTIRLLADRLSEASADPVAVSRELAHFHAYQSLFERLLVADPSGRVIAGYPPLTAAPEDIAMQSHFQAAASGQTVAISDGLRDSPQRESLWVAFAAPIRSPDGNLRGVVEGRAVMPRFAACVSAGVANRGEQFQLVMLDRQLQVLTASHPDLVQLGTKAALPDTLAGDEMLLLRFPVSGKETKFLVWQELEPETGWRCLALVPPTPIITQPVMMFIPFLLVVPFILFAVAWAARLTVRLVLHPLDELTATAQSLSTDPDRAPDLLGWQAPAGAHLPTEIAHLTEAFRAMALKVSRTMADLRVANSELEAARRRLEAARDNLERELAARTADIKRREEARSRSQKLELLGQLTGGIAHNFNNLLTVILNYSSLLLSRCAPDDPSCKPLRAIRQASERGRDLIKQLMAYSRAGDISAPMCFPLHESLRTVQGMVERLFDETVKLETNFAAGDVFVCSVLHELEQVFLNLLVNARDAMPDGGHVRLETSLVTDVAAETGGLILPAGSHFEERLGASPMARISVRDTGTGMPPEVLKRLGEPFFTTKEKHKGTGLGLSTALQTVTAAGGLLRVESEVGQGTVFHVYLPVVNPATSVRLTPEGQLADAIKLSAQSIRLLVVEDEPDVRAAVSAALVAAGFSVTEAEDGQVAWDLICRQTEGFDLVIADVRMPKVNGIKLACSIWERYPTLPVLFISGYTDIRDTESNVVFKDNLLYKPFTAAELVGKVKAMVGDGVECGT